MIAALITSALLAQANAGVAATPVPGIASSGPGAVATAVAPQADDDKVVCRREEETGSRVNAHRTCMTKLQWRIREADSRNAVDALQRNGNHAFGAGPG